MDSEWQFQSTSLQEEEKIFPWQSFSKEVPPPLRMIRGLYGRENLLSRRQPSGRSIQCDFRQQPIYKDSVELAELMHNLCRTIW
ncbi:hypothetical protein CEXT_586451 [Caerostris extrusa]|uniref:Uncharacterized protein n=1 Tax=Caerostris extrusa TaxID=172846 RepID=A0AAV4RCS9_CAEEX|nr:hypothetical protein CEXT_586451 [Caerostris extrusa]